MSSLAEELDQPIIVNIAEHTFKLGILDLADLAQIQQEVRAEKIQQAIADLPNSHTAADIQNVQQGMPKLTIEGLAVEIFDPIGCSRFLRRELLKGDTPEGDVDVAVKYITRKKGLRDAAYLAAEASGLYPAKDDSPEKPDPNAPAGSNPAT